MMKYWQRYQINNYSFSTTTPSRGLSTFETTLSSYETEATYEAKPIINNKDTSVILKGPTNLPTRKPFQSEEMQCGSVAFRKAEIQSPYRQPDN